MFGIMRPEGGCSHQQDANYRQHRMHYCGTCKVMGTQYGHKSRFLLNYDTVFLAELLSEIGQEDLSAWEQGFQAINQCFTMPKEEQAMPISLRFAADANLLLAAFKVEDHLADSRHIRWKLTKWFYKQPFKDAAKQMTSWGLPMEELSFWQKEQLLREQNISRTELNPLDFVEYYAAPTAQMTALVFAQGALAINRPDLESQMAGLGSQLGSLAYWLDAFEDLEKDAARKEFNPFLTYYNSNQPLAEIDLETLRGLILNKLTAFESLLLGLGLSTERVDIYFSRLRSNVAMQLYKERFAALSFGQSITMRWKAARQQALELTCHSTSWSRQLNYQLLSVALFVAPQTQEYMGMGSKESFVFSWAAFLTAFMAAMTVGVGLFRPVQPNKPNRKEKRTWKQFFRKLKKGKAPQVECCEVCATACCVACCTYCCESPNGCCSCFNSMCSRLCRNCGKGDTWIWWLVAFAILVIGVAVLLVILI